MSKYFCSYPWEHIYVHTSGHQRLCCTSDENITKDDGYYLYNLKQDGLTDSWNSDYMKNIRKSMIEGKKLKTCYKCWDAIDQGLQALRRTSNQEFHINNTEPDGSINYPSKDVQLHFGNVCNLNCKMCSQMYSHSIGKELLKMGDEDPEFLQWVKKESGVLNNWTGELDMVYDWYKNEKVKKSIFDHVSENIKSMVVIGGEPTIIKEFYELLEYCHSRGTLKDKNLTITTNMTNTNKNLSTWLGSVKSFMLHASIDGIDDRNQYIRFPCNWSSVLSSILFYKSVMEKYNNGHFSFAPAIQLLNIDQLDDLTKFFIDNFATENCGIAWISQVRYPIICDYDILPTEYKLKIADRLESSAKNMEHKSTASHLSNHAKDLRVEKYNEQQKQTYQKMFVRYNDQQDRFRGRTTWRQLLPDLETALTKSVG
jgi:MoaA/NifB/PqqE/SkfB family radical SAM enzyme